MIQRATLSDIGAIQHVLSTTWQITYAHLQPETITQIKAKWHSTEFLSKQIENPKFLFLVFQENTDHYSQAKKLRIYVDEKNKKAITFYKHHGFILRKKLPEKSFGETLMNWLMEKPLS